VRWDPADQQLQQSHHFQFTLNGNRVRHAPTHAADAKNCAGQSGLNWPCFDQTLEVSTSSTFLLMLGVLLDQFSMLLCHWEGLMELQWQGGRQNASCMQCIKMRVPHRIVRSRPLMRT